MWHAGNHPFRRGRNLPSIWCCTGNTPMAASWRNNLQATAGEAPCVTKTQTARDVMSSRGEKGKQGAPGAGSAGPKPPAPRSGGGTRPTVITGASHASTSSGSAIPKRDTPARVPETKKPAGPSASSSTVDLGPRPESPGKPARMTAAAASVSKPSVGDASHNAPGFSAIGVPSAGAGAGVAPGVSGWATFAKAHREAHGAGSAPKPASVATSGSGLSKMSSVTRPKGPSDVADPSAARSTHATSSASSGHGSSAAGAGESLPKSEFVHPEGVAPEVRERGYPLGFTSLKQFRDLTRSVARENREGTVIVSGSSVTGYSAKKGTRFEGNPDKPKSDIDVGVIREYEDPAWHEISDRRGFPIGHMSEVERQYGTDVRRTLGRPTGIKFFDPDQIAEDGRSYLIRPHTPPRSRPGAGAGSSSSGSGPRSGGEGASDGSGVGGSGEKK